MNLRDKIASLSPAEQDAIARRSQELRTAMPRTCGVPLMMIIWFDDGYSILGGPSYPFWRSVTVLNTLEPNRRPRGPWSKP